MGVGPGDPEFLTLRACRVIEACATILHAGARDDSGFALEIIASRLRIDQTVRGMGLAMRRGADDGTIGYERVARTLLEEAGAGRDVAYLTEGDPMLYGSGSYIAELLAALAPEATVEVVPGVSSLAAAAARLGWPLAQKDQMLTICPATYHVDEIGAILDRGGMSCWLKAVDVLPRLAEELRVRGLYGRAAVVERLGRPEERVFRDLDAALAVDLSYFSLALVR